MKVSWNFHGHEISLIGLAPLKNEGETSFMKSFMAKFHESFMKLSWWGKPVSQDFFGEAAEIDKTWTTAKEKNPSCSMHLENLCGPC